MTASPPPDPFVALWQTAAKPDTQRLLQDLQRVNQTHQRLNRALLAIGCGIALLLIFEEVTGRLMTRGILSVTWMLGLGGSLFRYRRTQCERSDALAQNTVSMLKFMLARARRGLLLARCLYAGTPLGALVGFIVARIAGLGAAPAIPAIHPQLHLIQTAAGVLALIVMMATGAVLARARHRQVQDFSQRLKSIESGL